MTTGDRRGVWRLSLVALLLVTPTLLMAKIAGAGRTILGIDLLNVGWYLRSLINQELRQGRLPLWDSHTMCGYPLLAAVHSAVFYPPAWLGVLLGDEAFWIVITWLHLALAGVFAGAWARRGLGLGRVPSLVAGLAFSLSGFVLTHLYAGHMNYVWLYPWAAAALWRLERWLAAPTLKRAVLLSIVMAMTLVAGVPQLVYAIGLVLAARLAWFVFLPRDGRRTRSVVAAGAVVALASSVALAAPQILPSAELLRETQRIALQGSGFQTTFSMPPENLLLFLAPEALGDDISAPYWGRWLYWEVCGYVGVVTLVLAALGLGGDHRQRWFWLGITGGGILLSLGRYFPLYEVFLAVVPGAGIFRSPGRYLLIPTLGLTALSALGMQRVMAEGAARRGLAAWAAFFGVAALVLGGSAFALQGVSTTDGAAWMRLLGWAHAAKLASYSVGDPFLKADFRVGSLNGAAEAFGRAAGWMLLSAVLLWARARGWIAGLTGALGLVVLLWADLGTFSWKFVKSYETAGLSWPQSLTDAVRRMPGYPFRIVSTGIQSNDHADPGKARTAGLEHAGGHEPILLKRYADLMTTVMQLPLNTPLVIALPVRPHPILFMLGVRIWIVPAGARAEGFRQLGVLDSDRVVLEGRGGLPRVWIARGHTVVADEKERLSHLARDDWDPRSEVVLEKEPGFSGGDGDGTAQLLSYGQGAYRVRTETAGARWLVLSEAWFPGWEATIDGRPVEIYRANHLVQAVRVPAGTHEVLFAYHSRLLPAGFALAALAVLTPFGIVLIRRCRRGRACGVVDRCRRQDD